MNISTLRYILRIVFSGVFLIFGMAIYAFSADVSMDTFYEKESRGLSVRVMGSSVLTESGFEKEALFKTAKLEDVVKVFLIWAGETERDDEGYKEIVLEGSRSDKIKADRAYTADSKGKLYSCFADITAEYEGAGKYRVKGIKTCPFGKKEKCSLGGYAVVIVYKDPKIKAKRRILIKSELLLLKPGEIHKLKGVSRRAKEELAELFVIGGHGLKGNASANLLNGVGISGEEDWDGSSGKYWDVDGFNTRKINIRGIDIDLEFDPLLQWIYPVSTIFIFEQEG